ncbi:MAG: DUF1566 domain-containing protein, partial [Spirochaetales bacterium]|nr:DUF1566 domain-containing protein [Spirochaetales bacterium]
MKLEIWKNPAKFRCLLQTDMYTKFFGLEDIMRKVILGILLFVLMTGGVAMAALVDNGNDTVTDTETGLMWQKETAPGTYAWQQALAYAEGLLLGGHSDWRLPNRNELQTLVDYSRYNPAIDPLLEANTMSPRYWSSTTAARHADAAWRVHFSNGDVYGVSKSSYDYVRAVRAGQSGSFDYSVILNLSIYDSNTGDPVDGAYITVGTIV